MRRVYVVIFCFVLFFIFSSKPCVRWARNGKKKKVQRDTVRSGAEERTF